MRLRLQKPSQSADLQKTPIDWTIVPKSLMTSDESKEVGFDDELLEEYPTPGEFALTTAEPITKEGRLKMIRWHRFLSEPQTPDERDMIKTIIEKLVATCEGNEQEVVEIRPVTKSDEERYAELTGGVMSLDDDDMAPVHQGLQDARDGKFVEGPDLDADAALFPDDEEPIPVLPSDPETPAAPQPDCFSDDALGGMNTLMDLISDPEEGED